MRGVNESKRADEGARSRPNELPRLTAIPGPVQVALPRSVNGRACSQKHKIVALLGIGLGRQRLPLRLGGTRTPGGTGQTEYQERCDDDRLKFHRFAGYPSVIHAVA